MNEFSLKIRSKDGDCILFERSSFICNYRQGILNRVNHLGGTIISNFEVELPSKEKFDSLLLFIGLMQADAFAVTVNHGKEYVAWISKTPKLKEYWNILKKHDAESFHGISTPEGFDFEKIFDARDFITFLSIFLV